MGAVGRLIVCEHNFRILFRLNGYTNLDLASPSYDIVVFDRRFVGV